MAKQDADNAAARRFWSSPGWLRLWGELMSGMRHDLTGRVSALNSLSIVASRGLAQGTMVTEELARESTQLAELAQVLGAFPDSASLRSVGVSMIDVVSMLPNVLRLVTEFRDAEIAVDFPDTLPAVVVDPGPARALLLLGLAQALARSAVPSCRVVGAAVPNQIKPSHVSITVEAVEPKPSDDQTVWLCEETLQGMAALTHSWGGAFESDAEKTQITITAPTL